ncbi:site-specific integrase [Massilia atriviolacea]|uniref:site-specific integrase n=1 Tax=Massilia atriviolacea TaxID=2495579 RepID=UPI0013E07D1D|nr:site-specific integrase [Massilia atriviolacea]
MKNKLLPKTFWATFDTFEEAKRYGQQLDGLLAQGIVPASLLEPRKGPSTSWSLKRCIAEYVRANTLPVSETKLLGTIENQMLGVTSANMNFEWAESWIRTMKRQLNLAPSTIRHRHGALARCLDWILRTRPEILAQNPLRLLKRGFAAYSVDDERHVLANGGTVKVDTERDRRLDPEEEERVLAVLADASPERTFFILALETAMRMRECYTLLVGQVSTKKRTIHLERTKNGDDRQVPLSTPALALLAEYMSANADHIAKREGRLFPFWSGDASVYVLDATTADLSAKFKAHFTAAKVEDFGFHDLRHEATCRLYEKTTLSDVLIAKITGHRDLRMLKRYASLRGSDLAARLW